MSDTGSILLATTILALGGLGLYAYKSFNEDTEDAKYNEDSLFGGSFWSSFNGDKEEKDEGEEEDDVRSNESDTESEDKYNTNIRKKSSKSKRTQKNNKSNGSSRRKY